MTFEHPTGLSYGRGCVYRIQYHFVWCVKYRKAVLVGDVEQTLRRDIKLIAQEFNAKIIAMEIMPDHVHLLVDCSPKHYIPNLIKGLKGHSARCLFASHPELKSSLWGGHLWNPSYFVATVSENTRSQVEEYIRTQKNRN